MQQSYQNPMVFRKQEVFLCHCYGAQGDRLNIRSTQEHENAHVIKTGSSSKGCLFVQ